MVFHLFLPLQQGSLVLIFSGRTSRICTRGVCDKDCGLDLEFILSFLANVVELPARGCRGVGCSVI